MRVRIVCTCTCRTARLTKPIHDVPEHYQITTFDQTDIPIQVPQTENSKEQEPAPVFSELATTIFRQPP